jgi:hypothetical protein
MDSNNNLETSPQHQYMVELTRLLPNVPAWLDACEWGSLRIDRHLPVIHRIFLPLSDTRTLYIHRLFNTGDAPAYMHSHSWPFALRLLKGDYEMGMGYSKRREVTPDPVQIVNVHAGTGYSMV